MQASVLVRAHRAVVACSSLAKAASTLRGSPRVRLVVRRDSKASSPKARVHRDTWATRRAARMAVPSTPTNLASSKDIGSDRALNVQSWTALW